MTFRDHWRISTGMLIFAVLLVTYPAVAVVYGLIRAWQARKAWHRTNHYRAHRTAWGRKMLRRY